MKFKSGLFPQRISLDDLGKKKSFLGFCHFPCPSFCYTSCTEIFTFFVCKKRNFYVMRHRTLEFKSQKIERKVTESQKIKNKLAEIGLFGSRELGFPYFTRSYLTSKIWKHVTFTRPKKSKFLCKHVNSYSMFLPLYKTSISFICCMTYKFYNWLQLRMYNSQFRFFLENNWVRVNS